MDLVHKPKGVGLPLELTSERIKSSLIESKEITAKKNSFDRHYFWFNYWEVTPSLWEKRLKEIPQGTFVFIPIYWGLHALRETKVTHYDFGKYRSDCDLKRIEDIALENDLKPMFCVPMTPVPFLKNGGLPEWIETPQSLSEEGVARNILTKEGKIRKIPSFYHPYLFRYYKDFLYSLGRTFVQRGFRTKVRGVVWGHQENGEFKSFLEDNSEMFQQSYERFLERNTQFEDSNLIKKDFRKLLKTLLEQVASECLESYWDGVLRVDLWGSGDQEFFKRAIQKNTDWNQTHWKRFFQGVSNNILPSDYLYDHADIPLVLRQALKDLVSYNYLATCTSEGGLADNTNSFRPLVTSSFHTDTPEIVKVMGLTDYLDEISPFCYEFQEENQWNFDEEDSFTHFFFAHQLEPQEFKSVLRLVMSGNKVVLETSQITEEQKRILELFVLENDLRGELIQSLGLVGFYPFGEGKLITIEGNKVAEASEKDKNQFWHRIYLFLGTHHLEVDADKGIMVFDLKRDVSPFELKYEEVRRTCLYNPTNKTLHLAIPHSRYFAFLRYSQSRDADIKSSTSGVSVTLAPQGSILLDFGYVGKSHG